MTITILDQLLIAAGIIVVALIGAYFAKYSNNMDDYFVAGRKMTFPLIMASMLASWHGMAFYLAAPSVVYKNGWGGWICFYGGFVLVDMAMGYFFAFKARMIGGYTVSDIFGKAYGGGVKKFTGIAYFIYMGVLPASEMMAIALVLNFVFGISTFTAICISAIFVVVYCLVAGQYAVFATDFIQYILMAIGLSILGLFALFAASNQVGILAVGLAENGWTPEMFRPTSTFSTTQIIGLGIAGLKAVISPLYWTRAYSAKSPKIARDGIMSSLYAMVSHDWLLVIIGLTSVIILGKGIPNPDQVTLHLIVKILPVGLIGLVLSALIAAGLSTVNSTYMAGASNFGRDIYKDIFNPRATQQQIVKMGRVGLVLLAIISMIIGYFSKSLVDIMYYTGQVTIPVFIVPILAIFFYHKPKTAMSAYLSMISGIIGAVLWLVLGEPAFFGIPMAAGLFGVVVSAIFFFIGNLFGEKRADIWNEMQQQEHQNMKGVVENA